MKIIFQAYVLSFFIWVAEVFIKTSLLSVVLFFTDSAPFYLLSILRILSLLFLCNKFWAIKKNRIPSWKSLFQVEVNYFNRIVTSLIILWWVMYEGSFQVCEGRWWKTIRECHDTVRKIILSPLVCYPMWKVRCSVAANFPQWRYRGYRIQEDSQRYK